MAKVVLGIIGGSGIYDLPGLTNAQSKVIESPWGKPSAPVLTGEITACRSYSCRATTKAIDFRRATSITAPILTFSSAQA